MIDIHHIEARHDAINQRLEEWARWVRVRPTGWFQQPMFRMYQSKARQWDPTPHIPVPTSGLKALEIERAVSLLPEKHREAIRWCYVWPWVPVRKVQRELALTAEALAAAIHDSRDMVKNRLKQNIDTAQ
jgi:hypothetical protein